MSRKAFRWIMCLVFGATVGGAISAISGYHPTNWQWWAAVMPIIITGVIYASV